MTATTTADGVRLSLGASAFNYYDMKEGHIESFDNYAQPNTAQGQNHSTPVEEWNNFWFVFRHTDGTTAALDGSRICSLAHAEAQGWIKGGTARI